VNDSDLKKIYSALHSYLPEFDFSLVESAYRFSDKVHEGAIRASGVPYISHPFETCLLVAKLHLDISSVIATLVHTTVDPDIVPEPVSIDTITEKFGEEVATLVSGISTLTRLEFDSKKENQVESFRMMLLAIAKDLRVVLIKLCDRLHVMQTLRHADPEFQIKLATETKDVYAPLANRLGLHWLKSELEDLVLLYLRPEAYKLVNENFGKSEEERSVFIHNTCKQIVEVLSKSGVSATVSGRAKHYASVWNKMERGNLRFEEIHDILGFRVIVPTTRACYETLGIIHSEWKPVPERFKDYIAVPKSNLYQSLHTTVIGNEGDRIEVQIRTPEMHRIAEEGVAAHWRYKEKLTIVGQGFDLKWVKDLIDSQQYLKSPDEFIQSVKGELFPEQVIVFTPKGDLLRLPFGSTCIDFAYAVHTDVGHSTVGAKINGRIAPLSQELENGDTIEILTGTQPRPSKDWILFAKSSKAKQRIRGFLRLRERAISIERGNEALAKLFRKHNLNLKKLEKDPQFIKEIEQSGFSTIDDCYASIGYGKFDPIFLLRRIVPNPTPVEENHSALKAIFDRAATKSREQVGVSVEGLQNIVVRFAKCCEPLPSDPIIGFISRGRGVTIHHSDCASVRQFDQMRLVSVSWDNQIKPTRLVTLSVHSQDQVGLLANMTDAISSHGINIRAAKCTTSDFGKVVNNFEIEIDNAEQLRKVKRSLELVSGVTKVERSSYTVNRIELDD
jgi:GTP diphosphokinase / guanosine-3',5'-bis(diphosphate) 3'-diphosphatase